MTRNYASNWRTIRRRALRATHKRCCWCLWRRAVEVHHARYHCRLRGNLLGLEVPGRDVFPLCDRCHGYLHRDRHYLEFDKAQWNRNTRLVIAQLQLLYQVRRLPLEWVALATIGGTALVLALR